MMMTILVHLLWILWVTAVSMVAQEKEPCSIRTIAGPPRTDAGDGGPAEEALLQYPAQVAFDIEGNLYIADSGNHKIRRILRSGIIETFAGTGVRGFSGDSGPALEARLNWPTGVAVDAQGNVFIADSN